MKLAILALLSLLATQANASWVSSYFDVENLAIGNGSTTRYTNVGKIPYAPSLEQLRTNYGSMGLKQIYGNMSNYQVIENNENLLELIKKDLNIDYALRQNGHVPMGDSLTSLSGQQIREIYYSMTGSGVVKNQRNYGGRGVGFCFGRALVAHNQALIRNVHPAAIRKIWVIGDMGFWGHHVATIVRSEGTWVAVDNYTGIVTVADWIKRMKQEQKGSKQLGFFITRAGRFGHQTNSLYNTIDLFNVPYRSMNRYASVEARNQLKANDFYKGFFMDFYASLEQDRSTVNLYSEARAVAEREERAIAEAKKVAERNEYLNSKRLDQVSNYRLSQETIYCMNNNNKDLNCNYQLGSEEKVYETSVTIAGYAQYQVQNQGDEKYYSRNITSSDIEDKSYTIVEDAEGNLTKRVVELVIPQLNPIRPYMKIISIDNSATQEELAKEVQYIKDVLAKFNNDYQVKAENASPLVRILNFEENAE